MGDLASPGVVRIAVEGCAHGELDAIYDRLKGSEVDLLLCCGDFESVRTAADLHGMAVPPKYRALGSFHRYYSGEKVAPVLTVFIGGNHEASQPLHELPYGGWVAPNIYYMGDTGIVQFNGVRIGGISGIFKSHDYRRGRFEVPPFDDDTMRSAYHYRNVDVHRLLCYGNSTTTVRAPDVMMSHDWPNGVHQYGDTAALLRVKPHFWDQVQRNNLGSPPTRELLDTLRPKWWFAAHMHVKFKATIRFGDQKGDDNNNNSNAVEYAPGVGKATDLVPSQAIHDGRAPPKAEHLVDDATNEALAVTVEGETDAASEMAPVVNTDEALTTQFVALESNDPCNGPDLTQQMTRFLSLDKCLPRRQCLAIVHVPASLDGPHDGKLRYDPEWLAVIRKTHQLTQTHRNPVSLPPVEPISSEDVDWIRQKLGDELQIPEEPFVRTVPAHTGPPDPLPHPLPPPLPRMGNPQTDALLSLLELSHVTTVPYSGPFVGSYDRDVGQAAAVEDENEIDLDSADDQAFCDSGENKIDIDAAVDEAACPSDQVERKLDDDEDDRGIVQEQDPLVNDGASAQSVKKPRTTSH